MAKVSKRKWKILEWNIYNVNEIGKWWMLILINTWYQRINNIYLYISMIDNH